MSGLDVRVLDLPADQLRSHVATALATAFHGEAREVDSGCWRVRTTKRGVRHTITVRVEERGHQSAVHVDVASDRSPTTLAALAGLTALTVSAWVGTALFTFMDALGPGTTSRIVAWVLSLGVSLGLTATLRRYAVSRHPNAIGALAPLDRFWKELATVEASPRVARGYRIAPEIVDSRAAQAGPADDANAEAEAAAEEAAEARVERLRD